ncbi:hypothetical protein [Pseudoramibacter porci]|uniref:Uncharacterized protein n=1 Tax=Pseudoramibacter porci TaxID=2606631 RepID=A0A7X2NGV5_9FIRM|nr:hypothetical protein [Pseudoramibacter porci]MSS20337.1 hypothetical protein [Pseudoramibacter porci]
MMRRLLEVIAKDLDIKQGKNESTSDWKARTAYSAAGKMALGSMWDEQEDNVNISVQHFRDRAEQELTALCKVDHDVTKLADVINEMVEEIYDIYLNCGFIYHSAYRIAPCEEKKVQIGNLSFVRSCGLQEKLQVCGLGLYKTYAMGKYTKAKSLEELYQLQTAPYDQFFEKLIKDTVWQETTSMNGVEYLRIRRSTYDSYWQYSPDEDVVSLMRMGKEGQKSYYFYKKEGAAIYYCPLPNWVSNHLGFRYAANWVLKKRGTLLPTLYSIDGGLVRLQIQYLYPPNILNFVKLYTWPESMKEINDFNRITKLDVFQIIQQTLEPLGFQFKERK